MHFEGSGIITSIKKQGENSAVVSLFTAEYGRISGLVKGASFKNKRGTLIIGNAVSFIWSARLAEHLGVLKLELLKPYASFAMDMAEKLNCILSSCHLIYNLIEDHDPHPRLYNMLDSFYNSFQSVNDKANFDLLENYVKLEVAILEETGFGLSLDLCAVTGAREGLTHVSPRTGRAVCKNEAQPYLDKLIELPSFLTGNFPPASSFVEIRKGLALTGYFLEKILQESNKSLPSNRSMIIEKVC